jgi:multisubunit Na+/H+ antiporter MnhF subunit
MHVEALRWIYQVHVEAAMVMGLVRILQERLGADRVLVMDLV